MKNFSTDINFKIIPINELKEKYIDVKRIEEFCKQCPIYNTSWACPPYSFDVDSYWDKYKRAVIFTIKINYDKSIRKLPPEQQKNLGMLIIEKEKLKFLDHLYNLEKEIPLSRILSAGSCNLCKLEGGCTKPEGKPCRHPDKMRYSVESLGGNLVGILDDYFDLHFKWTTDSTLPEYHILAFGLLLKD